jgi:probable selenium-dependent hydroxylase accessory protein YqeC
VNTQNDTLSLFSSLFSFKPNSLVNFVGGGGKTILIHKLMEEFVCRGHVLYTTTMRIHPPTLDKNMVVISGDDLTLLETLVTQTAQHCSHRNYKIVATRKFMEPDLLNGVPSDFLKFIDRSLCTIFLNEADGSARFSLKLPRDSEPVLMENAEYLVPVIGIDCLHKAAGPKTIFRLQTQSSKFAIQEGDTITPELAVKILMHPQGVCKDWKDGVTIIPFINKVDTPDEDSDAQMLAELILRNNVFPVNHVVWGSVRFGRSGSIL